MRMMHTREFETYIVFADHIKPSFLTKNEEQRKQKQNIEETYDVVV
jgi:hypothetical protein